MIMQKQGVIFISTVHELENEARRVNLVPLDKIAGMMYVRDFTE